MLLKNISNEFTELDSILGNSGAYDNGILKLGNYELVEITTDKMVKLIPETRMLTKQQIILENKKFESKNVNLYKKKYIDYISFFLEEFDECMETLGNPSAFTDKIRVVKRIAIAMYNTIIEIRNASFVLKEVSKETLEPLPLAMKENKLDDITILSENKSVSLSGISKDISTLDNFLNNISSLIKEAKGNNFYLRKVESGSLAVVISCIAGASQIVSFIFFYIKLCQKTEKRELKNEERKLEIINKSLDTAKKIFELDPQNTEANEIVQKCGLYILEFLENNPKGTINNQSYDIGAEKLKIEEKKEN